MPGFLRIGGLIVGSFRQRNSSIHLSGLSEGMNMSPSHPSRYPRILRAAAVGCVLFSVFLIHVAMRYLHISLFGFVKYRGLAPVVPWIVLGAYLVLLLVLAGLAVRQGERAGLALGIGLLLLAVEPFTILNGGCEVGSAGGTQTTIPRLAVDGVAVIVWSWNGSCTMYLNSLVLGLETLVIAAGLWLGSLPDVAFTRWLQLINAYWPPASS